jgi:hypothetical protein
MLTKTVSTLQKLMTTINSLLTTFSKLLEKVMYNRLSHYLQTNNILVPEQSGFRKGISTESAAFRITHNVLKSLNKKKHVGGISVTWLKTLTL